MPLLVVILSSVGLSACGAPQYTYVADSAAGTYYKVPYGWHQISQQSLNQALAAAGGSGVGIWSTAFDAESDPSASHFLAGDVTEPFVFAEVGQLSSTASNELSYNMLRDFMLPVTSSTREQDDEDGFPLTDFKSLRDETITANQGVHGVRETFQYTYPGGISDTFDEDVLTNADQTVVYFLMVHCTNACYAQNENDINTIMTSFTVGSPT
ncbi:hypothetical protein [Trebonia sp.]|uniref:hypothetical protein n=1 Tax=Trebonia sp. TaxID=2767075 RepID=UPI002620A88D|nr:hypothetical protein [Trebonia sp.]